MLSKTSDQPANITIQFDQYSKAYTIERSTLAIEFDYNLTLAKEYKLVISRDESDLYSTDKLVHDSYIIIDKIIIDDFWEIAEGNHWSKTIYKKEYISHVLDKNHTWELTKDLFNNVLYFNGEIEYTISTPIRGMFF
jgi:hypothetical protein